MLNSPRGMPWRDYFDNSAGSRAVILIGVGEFCCSSSPISGVAAPLGSGKASPGFDFCGRPITILGKQDKKILVKGRKSLLIPQFCPWF